MHDNSQRYSQATKLTPTSKEAVFLALNHLYRCLIKTAWSWCVVHKEQIRFSMSRINVYSSRTCVTFSLLKNEALFRTEKQRQWKQRWRQRSQTVNVDRQRIRMALCKQTAKRKSRVLNKMSWNKYQYINIHVWDEGNMKGKDLKQGAKPARKRYWTITVWCRKVKTGNAGRCITAEKMQWFYSRAKCY